MSVLQFVTSRVVISGLVLGLALPVIGTSAQEAPPEPGALVLEDSLSAPGVLGPRFACPSGHGVREFVGEGSIIKVTGKCFDTDSLAAVGYRMDTLTVPDGEIRLEVRAVSGPDRGRFRLLARVQPQYAGYYEVQVDPARGFARLARFADGQFTVLKARTDLGAILAPGDWNSIALRLQGPNLWLLVNDQVALSASDSTHVSGVVYLGALRLGDLNDDQESAVVLRNLRVSALVGADEARAPAYQAPQAATTAITGEPWLGDITFGYDPSGNGAVPSGSRLPLREAAPVYLFFQWQNVPAGSKITISIRSGGATFNQWDITPSFVSGRYGSAFVTVTANSGTGRVSGGNLAYDVILSLDGREMARGWVEIA